MKFLFFFLFSSFSTYFFALSGFEEFLWTTYVNADITGGPPPKTTEDRTWTKDNEMQKSVHVVGWFSIEKIAMTKPEIEPRTT